MEKNILRIFYLNRKSEIDGNHNYYIISFNSDFNEIIDNLKKNEYKICERFELIEKYSYSDFKKAIGNLDSKFILSSYEKKRSLLLKFPNEEHYIKLFDNFINCLKQIKS